MQRPAETDGPAAAATILGRRDALALLAGLAALHPALAAAQPALDKAAFLEASSLATGLEPAKLTGMTDALLAAFQAQSPTLLQLATLARVTPPADLAAAIKGTPMEPVARALAAAWYTGTLGTGANARLLSYEDAAAWKAAGYEAVPGMCAGEFGFWSDAPAPT
jgi:hypothetical protein